MTENLRVDLPSFLVVGAAKSGTSSLQNYLSTHPDVFLPKIKETWFWHIISNPNKAIYEIHSEIADDFSDYVKLFEGKENKVCGEVCPSYLYYHQYTIENLKRLHPDYGNLKIVIILREPVSKVKSHFNFMRNNMGLKEDATLKEALAKEDERLAANNKLYDYFYYDNTRYYEQVKAYKDNFKHVKVLLFDDLKRDPESVMKELSEFIQIDPSLIDKSVYGKVTNAGNKEYVPANTLGKLGSTVLGPHSYKRRLTKLLPSGLKALVRTKIMVRGFKEPDYFDEEILHELKERFRPEVEQLSDLLDVDLVSTWGY
jgi:hypothetical protein